MGHRLCRSFFDDFHFHVSESKLTSIYSYFASEEEVFYPVQRPDAQQTVELPLSALQGHW
jgi:hypothetical protein